MLNTIMRGSAKYIAALMVCLVPEPAPALEWEQLWLNDNQRAAGKMAREDYTAAARTFDDPRWQAAAWYRAGEYERAASAWAKMDDTEAHYNRGNALARAGRLVAAVNAYETALARDPGHADARHNLEVLRERMRQSGRSDSSDRPGQADGSNAGRSDQQGSGQSRPAGRQSGRRGNESPGRPQDPGSQAGESGGRDRQAANRPDDRARRGAEMTSAPRDRQDRGSDAERMPETGTPEEQAAMEQWLRRVPDDPGGLLRRKFLYQYRARQRGYEEVMEPW